ncbi:MAG: SGNH/GDSL hydrolase family protein [Clostridia bacterium]|nr:SGNH/GDSL hydrolase family protein [Clostridia bacterium]
MKLGKNEVILFSGDSITDGNRGKSMDCNHIMGHGYQYTVAGRLALDNAENMPKFINKGYSGETAGGLLEKWQADVIENKPTILSILVGVNDGGCGYFSRITPEKAALRYETNLRAILETTRKELGNITIVVCEPFYFPLDKSDCSYKNTPHPDGVEGPFKRPDSDDPEDSVAYRVEANKIIRAASRKLAEEYGCIFVPLYDKIHEQAARSRMEYFIWDGTHPSIACHMLIADEWLRVVEEHMNR